MKIPLKDNQFQPTEWNDSSFGEYDKEMHEKILERFDNVSLRDLSSKEWNGKKYLVFPEGTVQKELNKKDNFIYKLHKRNREKPAFQTGNVMGFFSLDKDVQMRIVSRFDKSDCNYFLHYMLQKVCNVVYVPQETDSQREDFFDFLYYLFPSYLSKACSQGIYRAYVSREYNDANIRGPIDVARHIRFNMPSNGKVAYHTREYTTDNKITQLIRHTIEYICGLKCCGSVFESSEKSRDNKNAIVAATPTYNKNLRRQVISQNLYPITHPYYTAYEPLRKICLAILCHKKKGYGNNRDNPIAGILFDGAALWEEYLAKVLENSGLPEFNELMHSNNRDRDKGVKLFANGGVYYPDFYRRDSKNSMTIGDCDGFILDAKYKQLYTVKEEKIDSDDESEENSSNGSNFHFQRNDLFQMLAYMHTLKANNAILVSPYEGGRTNECYSIKFSRDSGKQRIALGYGGEVNILALPICADCSSFEEFSNNMKKVEKAFLDRIKEFL